MCRKKPVAKKQMFIRELNIKGYCFSSCAYSRMGFAAKCMTSSNGIKVLVLWCCTAVLDVDTVSVCVIQMYFAKLSHAVVHFLKRTGFLIARLLATLANKPYVFSLFLIALSLTLTCNIPNEGCRVWDVDLGSFAIFLAIAQDTASLNFGWICLDIQSWENCNIVLRYAVNFQNCPYRSG